MARVATVLTDYLQPLPYAEIPVQIIIKPLRFGYNRDKSFKICHLGIFGAEAGAE
jgi:hypothetical protein